MLTDILTVFAAGVGTTRTVIECGMAHITLNNDIHKIIKKPNYCNL